MEQLYNSTIAAISTAMSNSGIGIVRMSGPDFRSQTGYIRGKKRKNYVIRSHIPFIMDILLMENR